MNFTSNWPKVQEDLINNLIKLHYLYKFIFILTCMSRLRFELRANRLKAERQSPRPVGITRAGSKSFKKVSKPSILRFSSRSHPEKHGRFDAVFGWPGWVSHGPARWDLWALGLVRLGHLSKGARPWSRPAGPPC